LGFLFLFIPCLFLSFVYFRFSLKFSVMTSTTKNPILHFSQENPRAASWTEFRDPLKLFPRLIFFPSLAAFSWFSFLFPLLDHFCHFCLFCFVSFLFFLSFYLLCFSFFIVFITPFIPFFLVLVALRLAPFSLFSWAQTFSKIQQNYKYRLMLRPFSSRILAGFF